MGCNVFVVGILAEEALDNCAKMWRIPQALVVKKVYTPRRRFSDPKREWWWLPERGTTSTAQ